MRAARGAHSTLCSRHLYESSAAYEAEKAAAEAETPVAPTLVACPACANQVSSQAVACPRCGQPLVAKPSKAEVEASNATAGCLALALGPVGFWYKRQWAAGFAWLVMTILLCAATGFIAAPFCWIGMAVHAAAIKPAKE